ncbi:hypothetical protein GCM10008949_28580 [Deinococcus humi]|nr:hypothetical protein GCM10008949_28580 [Deinococcus humi]
MGEPQVGSEHGDWQRTCVFPLQCSEAAAQKWGLSVRSHVRKCSAAGVAWNTGTPRPRGAQNRRHIVRAEG